MPDNTHKTCSHADPETCPPWCGRDPKRGRMLGIYFDPPHGHRPVFGGSKRADAPPIAGC